jgi:glycosyltransferase involved in cell wall biosynthesis
MKTLLIIPAFNEAEYLSVLLGELHARYPSYDVLVVNDGSSDATGQVALAGGARVIELPFNLGIGGAEQTGFLYAARNGYDVVIRLDGDGQHPPEEVETLICALDATGADVVIGSRYLRSRSFRSSWLRQIGIRWLALLITWLTRHRITDSTSGFRAFRCSAFTFLAHFNPQDFPEPESVVLLVRNGFRVQEVSVRMRDRQGGRSSIRGIRPIYFMLKVTLALLITAIRHPESVVRET